MATTPPSTQRPRPVTPLGILAESLADISRRIEEVDGADQAIRDDLQEACALAAGLDPYLSRCTTPESSALRALADRTQAEDWAQHLGADGSAPVEQEMLSGHVEGQLLEMLVHATKARRVLDVGMFSGYSALAMAEALPDDGVVVACEIDAYVAEFAQSCFDASPAGAKIDVRVGPATDTLTELAEADTTFDLVFIDADKGGYTAYLELVVGGGLLAPGGLVCVDNTLMQGQPWISASERRRANGDRDRPISTRRSSADPRIEPRCIIPIRDGLTVIRRVDITAYTHP